MAEDVQQYACWAVAKPEPFSHLCSLGTSCSQGWPLFSGAECSWTKALLQQHGAGQNTAGCYAVCHFIRIIIFLFWDRALFRTKMYPGEPCSIKRILSLKGIYYPIIPFSEIFCLNSISDSERKARSVPWVLHFMLSGRFEQQSWAPGTSLLSAQQAAFVQSGYGSTKCKPKGTPLLKGRRKSTLHFSC